MVLWSTPDLKLFNKERIRREIQNSEKCTKAQIAKLTSLSVATCNTAINEMLADHEIMKVDQEDLIMGRPADRFCYNREFLHVVGMSLTGDSKNGTIGYMIADAVGGTVREERSCPKTITSGEIENLIAKLLEEDPLIRGVSIGIPGVTVDGAIERCDIESMIGVYLAEQLQNRFGIQVDVRNDMDYIAYGAYHNIYQGQADMAAMYFPMNSDATVGCGFIINGRVLEGFTKFSGELSYILEGFGISRKEQFNLWTDREKLIQSVARQVLIVISTVDPEEIILMGLDFTEEELEQVRTFCRNIVSESHLPKIIAIQDHHACYFSGMIRAAVNQLLFPISDPI